MYKLIFVLLFTVSISAQKVYTLQKVTVPPKPVAVEDEKSDEEKFLLLNRNLDKDNDEVFRTFMLLNIYTEQRKTNRILNEIKEEEENDRSKNR